MSSRNSPLVFVFAVSVGVLLLLLSGGYQQRRHAVMAPPPMRAVRAVAPAPDAAPSIADPNITEESVSTESNSVDPSADDPLPKVRKAARDQVAAAYPAAKVEGVWTLPLARGLYLAGVDASFKDTNRRATLDLLVRLYVRRTGSAYWRAEGLGANENTLLLQAIPQKRQGRVTEPEE